MREGGATTRARSARGVALLTLGTTLMWAQVVRAEPPPATGDPPKPVAAPGRTGAPDPTRPPPLHVDYAQYGVALAATVIINAGAICGSDVQSPVRGGTCILGSGGGLVIRAGYRSPGPWYLGGSYEFTKMDSSNLYRLGIFQQLRAEMRYLPDTGYRAAPYVSAGIGGVAYGNEWGVETGGGMLFFGGGLGFEVSRLAVLGLGFSYRPTLIAGWQDTARIERPTGLAQFFGVELQLEVRSELGRR